MPLSPRYAEARVGAIGQFEKLIVPIVRIVKFNPIELIVSLVFVLIIKFLKLSGCSAILTPWQSPTWSEDGPGCDR
jgi:antibiotic biosynthesis monooxygenase (ABM) superfamily enzyme